MKKVILGLLFVSLFTMIFQWVSVFADSSKNGEFGDGLKWYFEDNGTLTIDGNGDMPEYESYSMSPWFEVTDYANDIKKLVLGSGVTSFHTPLFKTNENLTEISVHEDNPCFSSIDGVLFSKDKKELIMCGAGRYERLYEVPDGVEVIREEAFSACHDIVCIFLGGVKEIGEESFSYCDSLKAIMSCENLSHIGRLAFAGCTELSSVYFTNSVKNVDYGAFLYNHSLDNVYFAGTEDEWNSIIFGENNDALTEADINFSAQFEPRTIFETAGLLAPKNVQETVHEVKPQPEEIVYETVAQPEPEYETEKETDALKAASGTCGEGVTWTFDGKGTLTISGTGNVSEESWYPDYCGEITAVEIKDGIKRIEESIFLHLPYLADISIADSVEYIYANSEGGGTIPVRADCPYYQNDDNWINGVLYADNFIVATESEKLVGECVIRDGTKYIAMATFNDCPELTSVIMPESLKIVGGYTFWNCPKLKEIRFSSGMDYLDFQVLGNCPSVERLDIPHGIGAISASVCRMKNLKSIGIPASVSSISFGAFYGCDSLTDVYYGGTKEQWEAMEYNENLSRVKVHFEATCGIGVSLNGETLNFDQEPVAIKGRTLVPLRVIFEAIGANVDWNNDTQTVVSKGNGVEVTMTLGSDKMYKNGEAITLDVAPLAINSRTLVPVRAVAEAFDCRVDWDGKTRTVIINTDK